jgi:phage gp29-like protein
MIDPNQIPATPERNEIATTRDGRDITRGYILPMASLAPQDEVLAARGAGNYTLYREVLRDDQVAAVFAQRRLAVTSCEWEVRPGGEKRLDRQAAEFLKEQLKRLSWDAITERMLYGVFYGYAVAECLWGREGARVTLEAIKVRDRRRFAYDGEMRLRLRTSAAYEPGELLPPAKFWSFCTGADHDDEPYGLGLAHWLYWPVFFKRHGVKFWLIFLEKFGMPTGLGKYPAGTSPSDQAKLLEAVQAIATDSGVIVPDGMLLGLVEAARSGTADYTALVNMMNAAIAKVVLGQTLTTEAVGGQYKAEVQMDVRQDLVKADADLVCQSFNRSVAKWLTEWNFPGAATPEVWRLVEKPEDLSELATRDKTLSEVGYKPTLARVQETYGEGYEPAAPVGAPPSSVRPEFVEGRTLRTGLGAPTGEGAEFAEAPEFPDQAALDAAIDAIGAGELNAQGRRLLAPIVERLREGMDPTDLLGWLAEAYPEMDDGRLQETLARMIFASELWGRLSAREEL